MPMTKTPKETKLKTEMGLEIKVLPSERQAEVCAKFKDQLEIISNGLEKGLELLLATMRDEKRVAVTAKSSLGVVYRFEITAKAEKIKVSKPKTGA